MARTTFVADERVDLGNLAERLGVSRATLQRWVGTRQQLLDEVLAQLTDEFLADARAEIAGTPDQRVTHMVTQMINTTVAWQPARGFARREPELALRLLIGRDGAVRRRLLVGLEQVIADELPHEAAHLHGFARAAVEVGSLLQWPALVAGEEPDPQHNAAVINALLVAARAGALSR